jgi:hypothetical protein
VVVVVLVAQVLAVSAVSAPRVVVLILGVRAVAQAGLLVAQHSLHPHLLEATVVDPGYLAT